MAEELNPFRIAQEQLDKAADIMKLDEQAHQILREPMRTLIVNIPVRMHDGTTKVFTGFRVHHNTAIFAFFRSMPSFLAASRITNMPPMAVESLLPSLPHTSNGLPVIMPNSSLLLMFEYSSYIHAIICGLV